MPKLHVFDDDKAKLKVADSVIGELKKLDSDWELGFCKPVQDDPEAAVMALSSVTDCVCVIDVEIKVDAFEKVTHIGAIDHLKNAIGSCSDQMKKQLALYQSVFGTHADYLWASYAFSYANMNAIPALVISTKDHCEDLDAFSARAIVRGLPVIANWKSELIRAPSEVKERISRAIAEKIHAQWVARSGSISGRLWPGVAIEQPGWFSSSGMHPWIKHEWNSQQSTDYQRILCEYLQSVLNSTKVNDKRIVVSDISLNLHNALKSVVGVCARVHGGSSEERLPTLDIVVLLACAWDPNAIAWYHNCKWDAIHPLMRDDASRTDLRAAILALGGEDGLFRKLLINSSSDNTEPPWKPEASTVLNVSAQYGSVILHLNFDVSTMADRFDSGKNGIAIRGGASNALLAVWKSLQTETGRTVDIEIDKRNNSLIFRKLI